MYTVIFNLRQTFNSDCKMNAKPIIKILITCTSFKFAVDKELVL